MSTLNKEPLISVIVPVFQIDKYLDKCISSIINQTYHNLEIILVDDGSFDNSPAICDKFQAEDTRVKVVHKENGGLSQARNVGLKLAKGEYIGFVDGDDWIEPNMYAILMSILQNKGADIAVCRFIEESEDLTAIQTNMTSSEIKQYTSEEALRMIIKGEGVIHTYVWNKLYKRIILSDINFPEGKIYEDNLWTAMIVGNAKSLVYIDNSLYHYLYRSESLSHNKQQLARRIRDKIEMCEQRINYIHEFYPALEKLTILNFQKWCYSEYLQICINNNQFDTKGEVRCELHRHFCRFWRKFILDKENFKMSLGRMLFRICPYLFVTVYIFYKEICNVIHNKLFSKFYVIKS